MRKNPGGAAAAVLDKKGGRVRVTPMDLVHTMGKSLAKAGYRCDLLFQDIDYTRPLDDPKTLDGILDYVKKQDQENTANQKDEWTNKKWDMDTVVKTLMKAELGGHYLAALKEAGVKIMVGECEFDKARKTSCYDPNTNTIKILSTHDSKMAVDTLAEEAKHALANNKKKEESILVSLFGHGKQRPQEFYNNEIAGYLARIVVYQDLLAAGAKIDS
jgi:hypothetical protein